MGNDDKSTHADRVMWTLQAEIPVIVYLNFRSEGHVSRTGATAWLQHSGFEISALQSTISTSTPNGPYSGPVYSKMFAPGEAELMGSNCAEGTYFVFVEMIDGIPSGETEQEGHGEEVQ